MKSRERLGDLIVNTELVSREEVESAVEQLNGSSQKLGSYLVEKGLISDRQLVELLSFQLQIEFYMPVKYPAETSLAELLPSEMAKRHHVVPLERRENLLKLGTTDPGNINTLDLIEQMTGREVEPVICTEKELNQLMVGIYGMDIGMPEGEDDKVIAVAMPSDTDVEEIGKGKEEAEKAPVVKMTNKIIEQAVLEGASDIHLSPEKDHVQVRFRIDGKLRKVPSPPKSMMLAMVSRIKIMSRMDISMSRVPQDGRFTVKLGNQEINIRVSSIPTVNGENIVMRLLDMSATFYSLDMLGMSDSDRVKIERLIYNPHGMILSTGPTGSGKSTSLYAILQKLNQPDINIITVEDPVEYRMDGIRQVQLNKRAGMTFASGLRSILRQDPDVIMVGEIRDAETAQIGMQASLTGHIVLSTVHTNSAAGAVVRLTEMGVEPFLVANVLMVSFAQRLLRRVCSYCKRKVPAEAADLEFWGLSEHEDVQFMQAHGCETCGQTGYKGRVGIFEVLVIDNHIREMILDRASAEQITEQARARQGMRTLREDAAQKILAGLTSPEEAMSKIISV